MYLIKARFYAMSTSNLPLPALESQDFSCGCFNWLLAVVLKSDKQMGNVAQSFVRLMRAQTTCGLTVA